MNFQARMMFAFVALIALGLYVNLFSQPAQQNVQPRLYAATTNEVVAAFGRPWRIVDSTNFIESADQMADEGTPVSTADMRPKGMVWLYPQRGVDRKGMRNFQTVFFDENDRVSAVYSTSWMDDFWSGKD
jgi:hypothetical protein